MGDAYLDDFLRARAAEVEDEETAELVDEMASELRDHTDDKAVLGMALWCAARFADHPDYRDEWRPGSDATVQVRGRY